MITKEEIRNLAGLARIEILEGETEKLTKDVDAILDYVGQITSATGNLEKVVPKLRNVMRDDVVTNEEGKYTEKLLSDAPNREDQYLKVKKIL